MHFLASDLKSDSLGSQFFLVVFKFKGLNIFWSSETLETALLNMNAAIIPCLNLNYSELLL